MSLRPWQRFLDLWAPLGIPLAWHQLMAEKKRCLAASAGIAFAVAMMLFQMGLRDALFEQVVTPHERLRGDLFLLSPQYEYLGLSRTFPARRLHQALALPEVEGLSRISLGNLPLRHPQSGRSRDIFVLACDPADRPFSDPEIAAGLESLTRTGRGLFDRLSHPAFGDFRGASPEHPVWTELAGRRVEVEGLFSMGPTFAADGNLIVDLPTYLLTWPGAHANHVSVGAVHLRPGAPLQLARERLRELLPPDVTILTKPEFIRLEQDYWAIRTPIGFVITASLLVAVIVGAVIVYQILYTDVTDHLPEYATLKALGYADSYFVRLVLTESLLLSAFGFLPGLVFATGLFALTRRLAHMPTEMTAFNGAAVFILTVVMCTTAGALAARRLRRANPAEFFR